MRKNMVIGIAMAVGMLSFGALTASAAGSGMNMDNCADKQVNQQFTQETAGLVAALNARNDELRSQNYTEGPANLLKTDVLKKEVTELKNQINAAALKHGVKMCSHS